jgi:uracil-DNA glycosylase
MMAPHSRRLLAVRAIQHQDQAASAPLSWSLGWGRSVRRVAADPANVGLPNIRSRKGNRMADCFEFGYPNECVRCANIPVQLASQRIGLRVDPFLKEGSGLRVMLVGQDPTVTRQPERVKRVLMLDEQNGQLSRWLEGIFGARYFESITLYATNVVKCTFSRPPSQMPEGGLNFLQPYFSNCAHYLPTEVLSFQPQCVITLGEPAHRLFISLLENANEISPRMKNAFTGRFVRARLQGFEFDYSPCLHIQTFRVAETYGVKVESFKQGLHAFFDNLE